MLSDVLSDCIKELEDYQTGHPADYVHFQKDIEHAKNSISSLLAKLDTTPPSGSAVKSVMVEVLGSDKPA